MWAHFRLNGKRAVNVLGDEMIANLTVALIFIIATTAIHAIGLSALFRWFVAFEIIKLEQLRHHHIIIASIVIVLGLFTLHGVQIWLYALFYRAVGAFTTMEEALYFSASTFTTVGFGDLVLTKDWRVLASIESANGFLLIGWSTAFLVAVTARLNEARTR